MRIAICDDNYEWVKIISEQVNLCCNAIGEEYICDFYYNGDALIEKCMDTIYAIVFLDIDMPQLDGIATAAKFRKINYKSLLVFVSLMENRVFDTFGYDAVYFVRKTNLKEEIKKCFEKCMGLLKSNEKIYLMQNKNGEISFSENEIVFIESFKRKLIVYSDKKGELCIENSLQYAINTLADNEKFFLINRSCIINFMHLASIGNDEMLIMDNNLVNSNLQVSRRRKSEFYSALAFYERSRMKC